VPWERTNATAKQDHLCYSCPSRKRVHNESEENESKERIAGRSNSHKSVQESAGVVSKVSGAGCHSYQVRKTPTSSTATPITPNSTGRVEAAPDFEVEETDEPVGAAAEFVGFKAPVDVVDVVNVELVNTNVPGAEDAEDEAEDVVVLWHGVPPFTIEKSPDCARIALLAAELTRRFTRKPLPVG